jgi:hypothetical protein
MMIQQIVNVDVLKAASAEFATMRPLAVRFRSLLRGDDVAKLDGWLSDTRECGVYGMRASLEHYARRLTRYAMR